jgi:hypothetical protein
MICPPPLPNLLFFVRKEAYLRYSHGGFTHLRSGDFVRYAVTKMSTLFTRLYYGGRARQEPYNLAAVFLDVGRSKKA